MKDWTQFVPPFESQYSVTTAVDADNCVEESFCHIVYCLTGFRGSPRALGRMAGVTSQGSDSQMALYAVNAVGNNPAGHGMIPYQLWPNPDSFTWQQFYDTIPQTALDFLLPVTASLVPADLNVSPLWTRLVFPNGVAHFVCQINDHQYFDSELGNPIKELSHNGAVVTSQMSVSVSNNFFLKSKGFTPAQFSNLPQNVQNAIVMNDNGAKNIIVQPTPGNYQNIAQE